MQLTVLNASKIFVCCLPLLANAVSAKTVQNLSQVKSELKTKDGKALYDKEMNGDVSNNAFGAIARNDRQTAEVLTKLVLPNFALNKNNANHWGLIGQKTWALGQASYPNTSVSVVSLCYSDEPLSDYEINQPYFADCSIRNTEHSQVALAVVGKNPTGDYRLLAQPYIEKTDSQNSDNSAFGVSNIQEEGVAIGDLDRLDMANYRLNATTPAFGVRYSTSTGYAGGGASHQGLTLFAIIDGKLKPVLHLPLVYQYENLAGEWHKDGTREHDITENNAILKLSNHTTAGFADITLHYPKEYELKDEVYRWNPKLQKYE